MQPRFAVASALVVSLLGIPCVALAQQQGKVTDLHAATARGATSANVKNDSPTNQAGAKAAPLPARKGGPKARGAAHSSCTLHVDNRADLIISVYLDGVRVGTMGRYGDAYQD